KQARALTHRQRLAVDLDAVRSGHGAGRRGDHGAVDSDPAGGDPGLRHAARAEPRARHDLGNTLAAPGTLVLPAHCRTLCSLRTPRRDSTVAVASKQKSVHQNAAVVLIAD